MLSSSSYYLSEMGNMSQILSGISGVCCNLDDILISEASECGASECGASHLSIFNLNSKIRDGHHIKNNHKYHLKL